MIDIFTALIGLVSISALAAVAAKILFSPAKIWDEENRTGGQIEEFFDYAELRKGNPHIWID